MAREDLAELAILDGTYKIPPITKGEKLTTVPVVRSFSSGKPRIRSGCGSSRPRYATPNGRSLATIGGEPDGLLESYCGKPRSLASAAAGIPMPPS